MKRSKIVVVMPAFNAAKTLKDTVGDIPPETVDEIILVDDNSSDETLRVARELDLKVVSHPMNRGYGSNQKTCYTLALSDQADIIVMIHPDYQYDSSLVTKMIDPILNGEADVMLGSRIRTRREALAGGMPHYKYFGNRLLTLIENVCLGQNLSEYHTGYRAFSSSLLRKVPFHRYSDNFVFDQQLIFGALAQNARIDEIAVPVRYFEEASSINFIKSCQYGITTLSSLALHLISRGRYFA